MCVCVCVRALVHTAARVKLHDKEDVAGGLERAKHVRKEWRLGSLDEQRPLRLTLRKKNQE